MKKILKGLTLFLLTLVLIPIAKVNAQSYNDTIDDKAHWIPGDYVIKQSGATKKYQQMVIMERRSDRQFVYCLQPGTMLDENLVYTGYDDEDAYLLSSMSKEQWTRIKLLAYYGYGYGSHTDQHWYSITQFMIWQTVPRGQDIYFTDTLNGNRIAKYTAEMQELETLVSNHFKQPSFSNTNQEMTIGDTFNLTDNNGVLEHYSVTSSNNLSVSKNGNTLSITANEVGQSSVTLTKSDRRFNLPPIIYVDPTSQDVMVFGSYDPLKTSFNINVIGGKITINKKDSETNTSKPQGEATLEGAIYGVYKSDGTKIATITTDKNGFAQSGYLPSLGDFYLREEKASKGYQLDNTNYYFTLTKDNLYPVVDVHEKVINRDFEFTKVYANSSTGIMKAEPNVKFGFYHNGELYKTATTDSNGRIKINLPYGKYVVKQLSSTTNYEKADDFEIEVYDMGDTTYKVIANAEITAKLKVIKIDKDTGDIIARAGIKFKIFNVDKNEYVCQSVTYPNATTICEFETNSEGILITPYPIGSGHYLLEEVDQVIDGYLWNDKSEEFEIGENSELMNGNEYGILFEVKFENKEVKGQVDLKKYGEELVIENGSYHYDKIPLGNVAYNLYASEDIYSANGVLIYKKDSLIGTTKTLNDGSASFKDLYLGKYYLLEQSSSNGNVVDSTKHYFELTYKDQYTAIVIKNIELENHLPKGTLEFTKTDLVTGEAISNTKIEIYYVDEESDKLIFTGYTSEDGKIVIDNLFTGKFYIIETEASTGYQITNEKVLFEITEDGEIVKANMTNEQIVEIPNTGVTDSKILNIISIILIVVGTGFIIYDKTKRK